MSLMRRRRNGLAGAASAIICIGRPTTLRLSVETVAQCNNLGLVRMVKPSTVLAGLVPSSRDLRRKNGKSGVDCGKVVGGRAEPGHDSGGVVVATFEGSMP